MRLVALCSLVAALMGAQGTQSQFTVDSRVVLVNAAVLDSQNRLQTDLKREDFSMSEDGRPVDIRSVSLEDVPISTLILFDISSSMEKRIGFARDALDRFLARTRTGDEYCLILFRDTVEPECEFSSDVEAIRTKAADAAPSGLTSLIDALIFGTKKIKSARNARKAILILSDGADTASRYNWKDAHRDALESMATLYAVSPPVRTDPGQWHSWKLKSVVEATGGRFLMARDDRSLADSMERLEIRLQYIISYTPPNPVPDRGFHRINLKLQGDRRKNQRVYWRHGYRASSFR